MTLRRTRRRRIVRVRLGQRTYAYRALSPCHIGDTVQVHARMQGWVTEPVVGFGRAWYLGRLKTAYPAGKDVDRERAERRAHRDRMRARAGLPLIGTPPDWPPKPTVIGR